MSRNDARKFLAQGTASALTLALGLTFAAQPAFAETAKAADPAAPVPAPAPSDGPSPEAPVPAPSEKPAAVVFKDVPQTHMFYQEITWLGETGISTGWSDGTFRPSQNIERAAIAAYFYRMAGSPDVVLPKQSPFTDVAPSDPFSRRSCGCTSSTSRQAGRMAPSARTIPLPVRLWRRSSTVPLI